MTCNCWKKNNLNLLNDLNVAMFKVGSYKIDRLINRVERGGTHLSLADFSFHLLILFSFSLNQYNL